MEQFTINIGVADFKEIHIRMDPGADVMEVAKALSIQYKGCFVTVSMHAINRRSYKDGEIQFSKPDLKAFYKNVTAQEEWDWSCHGQVTD